MSKYLTLGFSILTSLLLLTTVAFGQGQLAPKSMPGKVLRPHLITVKINLVNTVAHDANVTFDILSTVIGQNATQADKEASKPTHYRWIWEGGGFPRGCEGCIKDGWSAWIPLQKNVKPSVTLKGCRCSKLQCINDNLMKGVCGVVRINFQVKNSAGESNYKNANSPHIMTVSEFCVDAESLLKKFQGKVSGGLGSACKVHKDIKRYVQGAEALSSFDEVFFGGKFGAGWMSTPRFFATGATPANGSKCEYELYKNRTLPEGWSVAKYEMRSDMCSGYVPVGSVKTGAQGCTMLKTPTPGTRDLTTKVRVWTDALKTPAVWSVFKQMDFIVKGDCRGLSGAYWPDMQ